MKRTIAASVGLIAERGPWRVFISCAFVHRHTLKVRSTQSAVSAVLRSLRSNQIDYICIRALAQWCLSLVIVLQTFDSFFKL